MSQTPTTLSQMNSVTFRFSVWSNVAKFINSFPTKAICQLDAVMAKICYYGMITFHGCDIAEEFVKICKNKQLNVITANNLSLPYQNNSYDYVLSIAVIHHFASYQHRKQAIKELIRVTKPSGKIFIEVWAFEQGKEGTKSFETQDVLVPFRNKHTREIRK